MGFCFFLFIGFMLDVKIIILFGFFDFVEEGDFIMVDKGFILNKVLYGIGIFVNILFFFFSYE